MVRHESDYCGLPETFSSVTIVKRMIDACDVEFDDRCFHLAVDEDMRFPAAKGYCRNLGWDLGTVYSEGHLRELESYFRHELPQHSDRIRLWIGGTSSEEVR